jgi:peptide/nickel transport system substrate-binding protein
VNDGRRFAAVVTATLMTAAALAGCGGSGGSSKTTSSAAAYAPGGTLQVEMGTFPDCLDPDLGGTDESGEGDAPVYTPLLTFAHKNGPAGTRLIPGLATALPVLSDRGKTYTFTLRPGLKFSNGTPLKVSDVEWAIKRSLKLNSATATLYTEFINGATAYQAGKSSTINGIQVDDATRKITFHLAARYGDFPYVLATLASAPVPASTPLAKSQCGNPPPGVGPYKITSVQEGRSFAERKNTMFASFKIPGIPTGYVNGIQVAIESNPNTEAQNVIDNRSDEFDYNDVIPPALLGQIESSDGSRYRAVATLATDLYFLNVRYAPFNNLAAREAANLAISRTTISRLSSGQIQPNCYFIPPDVIGHASGPCPFVAGHPTPIDDAGSAANVAEAKALVSKAGLAGTKVTVWTLARQPFQAMSTYVNSQLNAIGFKSSLRVLNDSIFYEVTENEKTKAQIGFTQEFPYFATPSNYYNSFDARTIKPTNNYNTGNVDDPHIQKVIIALNKVPHNRLDQVAPQWAALEKYNVSKDYVVGLGDVRFPLFLSDRVDFAKAVLAAGTGDDWTTFELKK